MVDELNCFDFSFHLRATSIGWTPIVEMGNLDSSELLNEASFHWAISTLHSYWMKLHLQRTEKPSIDCRSPPAHRKSRFKLINTRKLNNSFLPAQGHIICKIDSQKRCCRLDLNPRH